MPQLQAIAMAALALAVGCTAADKAADDRQDEIVAGFQQYVTKSVHDLEDLQNKISEHRQAMEHGEEIRGTDFQPLPSLGLQSTTTEAPTTRRPATSTTTRRPATSTTTRAPWAGFLGGWGQSTPSAVAPSTTAPTSPPPPPATTTQAPWPPWGGGWRESTVGPVWGGERPWETTSQEPAWLQPQQNQRRQFHRVPSGQQQQQGNPLMSWLSGSSSS